MQRCTQNTRTITMICVAYLSVACSGNGCTVKDVEKGLSDSQTVAADVAKGLTMATEIANGVSSGVQTAQALKATTESGLSKLRRSTFQYPHNDYKIWQNYGCLNCLETKSGKPSGLHTGIDSHGNKEIVAIGYGIVEKIQPNGKEGCKRPNCADHGLGNTVIIKHFLVDIDQPVYSMYSHLDSFADGLKEKVCIKKGDPVGTMGSTGYGQAKYWDNTPHLHLEIKTKPVLNSPSFGGATYGYISPKDSGNDQAKHKAELEEHGFYDPKDFIEKKSIYIPNECPLF